MKKTTSRTRQKSKRTRAAAKKKTKRKTRLSTRHGSIDIEHGLGGLKTPRAIAKTLKRAADASQGLTNAPYQAAIAALDQLIAFLDRQKERLEAAKIELRKLYGEDEPEPAAKRRTASAPDHRPRATTKGANGKRPRKRGDVTTSGVPRRNIYHLPS